MRSLEELLDAKDPAFPLVQSWLERAVRPVELLAPGHFRGDVLVQTQVTTRSPMGAVVYETGGILIDNGWLRVLGSGHERLRRTLPGWNEARASGFYLIADDAVGGFFALNGGAFGEDLRTVYYLAPDTLNWESLGIGYSGFLEWACVDELELFYESFRWPGWEEDVAALHGDRCFFFYPPLFTSEGRKALSRQGDVSVHETWGLAMEFREQLGAGE
jgi:hypothetical protein